MAMRLDQYAHSDSTYVVAEIGQAHDGSLGILHSLVDVLAKTGDDAIKFQMHIADAESSDLEPFRVKFSPSDVSRYDYWKRMELTQVQWNELKSRCDALGVEFLATPFSNAAVDMLEELEVEKYKVGSGDLSNPLLLERIARTGKELIISTGLANMKELDRAVDLIRSSGNGFGIMQCTTSYPTEAVDVGLAWIPKCQARYGCPVGLSDHSGRIYAGLGAVALGANMVEFHTTFDKRMFGPDSAASLTISEVSELVEGIRFLEQARAVGPEKGAASRSTELSRIFGKSLAVNRDLPAGHVIVFEDLEGKKPSDAGLSVKEIHRVIGRVLSADKKKWDFIHPEDLD